MAISLSGVNDGTRTHDNQCHKLALYQLNYVHHMERVVGIEPTFPAWKAGVLPIYDTRKYNIIIIYFLMLVNTFFNFFLERKTGLEPATSTLARWRSTIEPLSHGADEGSRTPTPKALDPKSSASANFATSAFVFGGLPGNRTPDTLIKSQVLYRLS